MKKQDPPIVITQTMRASRHKIWAALTEVEHMRQWFFEQIPAFVAEVGFETVFDVKAETRVFPHHWKVIEVIPQKSITTQWQYGGYEGICTVTFRIEGEGPTHDVTVEAKVIEDFDSSIPEFRRESAIGGWTYFIKQQLKENVEKSN